MKDQYDVVIIGGAVIGSSIAYFLSANPDFDGSVLVVERDPSYTQAATSLSSSGIRVQYSNAINVKISQFGGEFLHAFKETMGVDGDKPDIAFHEKGYLFLANTEAQAQTLRENHAVQRACGADVVLWDRDELVHAFPHLRVDDILLASYGRHGEGWFNNTGLMNGFRTKARSLGADYIKDEVVALERTGARITGVVLASGQTVQCGDVVNAAGTRSPEVAHMAGLSLPIEPRKRTLFVIDCAHSPQGTARVADGGLPLMIDPSGVFCRPEGRYFLAGGVPAEDPAVAWDDFEPGYSEFEDIVWPALAARSAAFEGVKVMSQWAGQYDYNVLDHNLIVGRHPEVRNFIFSNGFSGHGLQQSPAVGRAVAELVTYGQYRTLDLSEVGYERVVANRPFLEKAVI